LLVQAALLVLASATPVHAHARLVSTRIASTSTQFGHCGIVNAGRKPITVTISLLSFDGTVLQEVAELSIEPGQSTGVSSGTGTQTFYCRFTGGFNKSSVRASASVNVPGGGTVVSVPAE
jgi:hypothetical protein